MLLGNSKKLREAEKKEAAASGNGGEPDWEALLQEAQDEGEVQNQNQFYIDEKAYKRLEPHLEKKKGINSDAYKGYQSGPEFDDLRCFLQTCQDLESSQCW